jgi:DNA-3-methyladenine glycosylase
MHYCFNVVTEEAGTGHAVLVRGIEPVTGVREMMKRRGISRPRIGDPVSAGDLINLCNGPAKFCQAFGIGHVQNGTDLCGNELWLARESTPESTHPKTASHMSFRVLSSTRIGITVGREHRWRFYIKNSPFVSRGKPVEG